jgi:hypothetical protein
MTGTATIAVTQPCICGNGMVQVAASLVDGVPTDVIVRCLVCGRNHPLEIWNLPNPKTPDHATVKAVASAGGEAERGDGSSRAPSDEYADKVRDVVWDILSPVIEQAIQTLHKHGFRL